MSMLRLSPYQWACPGWCLTQRLDGGEAVATDQGAGVRSRSRVKEVVWRWHSALRSRPGQAALLLTPASITRGGGEQVRWIRERRLVSTGQDQGNRPGCSRARPGGPNETVEASTDGGCTSTASGGAGHGVPRHHDHSRPGRDAGPGRRRDPRPRGRPVTRAGSGGAPTAAVAPAAAAG